VLREREVVCSRWCHTDGVIPGRDEVASYDAQSRIGESITTIGSMDSGLALRAPRNDDGGGVGYLRSSRSRQFALRAVWPEEASALMSPATATRSPVRASIHLISTAHRMGSATVTISAK
jgi:hypothetical protein